jgi:hypothetical protein
MQNYQFILRIRNFKISWKEFSIPSFVAFIASGQEKFQSQPYHITPLTVVIR